MCKQGRRPRPSLTARNRALQTYCDRRGAFKWTVISTRVLRMCRHQRPIDLLPAVRRSTARLSPCSSVKPEHTVLSLHFFPFQVRPEDKHVTITTRSKIAAMVKSASSNLRRVVIRGVADPNVFYRPRSFSLAPSSSLPFST